MKRINLFCNNKKFKYDGYTLKKGIKTYKKQGEGLESIVFKIDDETVLKVYKDSNEKAKLNESMIKELSQIDTNRIVLPNNIITDEDGETKGYSMDYKEDSEASIIDYPKEQLIEELSLLKDDLTELGENKVEIGDLREENTISNESSFYLIDCGDYLKRKKDTTKVNYFFFNEYLINDILIDIIYEESTDLKKGLNFLKEVKMYLLDDTYIGDYLKEKMQEQETLNEYVKRKVK